MLIDKQVNIFLKKNWGKLFVSIIIGLLISMFLFSTDAITEEKTDIKKYDPEDPDNPIYLGGKGNRRSTGNISKSGYASEAARLGAGWHPPAIDTSELPRDKFNLINWVELVNKNVISPKPSLDPYFEEQPPLDLNILFQMRGGFVDNVLFPHDIHTYWLDCTNCHDGIFIPAAGSNRVRMQEIVKGEWCGRCHGRVAFPIADCTRCHRFSRGHKVEESAVKRISPP
ncbi:MAG: cytochrome c3 family protein [Nitrospirota bacterium]